MAKAIKVEGLSKAYQLGDFGTGTISRDIERFIARVRGKEDPFLKIGQENDRSIKGESDIVWSLRDLNFEIGQGDAVGIIGRNGAGKSTLLKILSRITSPTMGSVKVKGRVASLLEVGTGFHPELTGRENIYLNGAILGMRKKEIVRKFDEIVDFSGVERYIDTPVKRYSSGMYVRLAFAVAAHLESEILIVDEVLAVGDAEFQKKCLGKMNDVSKGEGRTVLFVSHNMAAIQNLCESAILLKKGKVEAYNKPQSIIATYLNETAVNNLFTKHFSDHQDIQLIRAYLQVDSSGGSSLSLIIMGNGHYKCSIDLRIKDALGVPVAFSSLGSLDSSDLVDIYPDENHFQIAIKSNHLAVGNYLLSLDITRPGIAYYERNEDILQFEILKATASKKQRHLTQEWNYGSYHVPIKLLGHHVEDIS